jgi:hypothetical protein
MQAPKNPAEIGKKFLEYLLATGPESNLHYSLGMAAWMAVEDELKGRKEEIRASN